MRVVVGGASGLLGSALTAALRADGHLVVTLVRHAPNQRDEVQWWPGQRELPADVLRGADAVVNLSGAGVGDRPWTTRYRRVLRDSRLGPTETLARAIATADEAPKVFLSASAVGYYGDTGDTQTDESGSAGTGFLPQLCVQWEEAASAARGAARVVHLRSGLVLAAHGGLLSRLRPLVRSGLGGRFGDGRQFQSWITLADHVAAMRFLIEHEVSGPVNVVGPMPARQIELIAEMGRLLHRPTVLPVPAGLLRRLLGEMATELLSSQRVIPSGLEQAGFVFTHRRLADALTWALRR